MALNGGLMLHRLTVDPEIDVRPHIERAERALAVTSWRDPATRVPRPGSMVRENTAPRA
jgi:hypothetical protein